MRLLNSIFSFLSRLIPLPAARAYRRMRAWVAMAWYGFPQKRLKIIGVTGTDGKTTVTNLLGHILKTTGLRTGWISTLGAVIHDHGYDIPEHTTTVNVFLFYKLLRMMARERIEIVVVELTSHALAQERVGPIPLACAVITNITHEHQDYHKNMDDYVAAKLKIFDLVKMGKKLGFPGAVALNSNDTYFMRAEQAARLKGLRVASFGMGRGEVRGERFAESLDGMQLSMITQSGRHTLSTRLLGDYNIYNILAASTVAHLVDVHWEKIHEGIETFQPLPGRFEPVVAGQPFYVFVDFAHTPNALQELLALLRRLTQGKLITVFGATGERDASKRPLMGEVVGQLSDLVFITEEDPRSERVEDISAAIAQGLLRIGKKQGVDFWLISDRRAAIREAFLRAQAGDVVAITGKGHERAMARAGGIDEPWSDHDVALEELERRGWRRTV